MHRRQLNLLLQRYAGRYPQEAELVARFAAFTRAHDLCLWRSCVPGHITASCWIVDADHQRCLLLQHRKLGKWLQPGGHVDGEAALQRAAVREAQEESGLRQFELACWDGAVVPLDLDVHGIPSRGSEPAHLHWDVRFLLRALPDQAIACSAESLAVRWCGAGELAGLTQEESVLRLHRKAVQWLPACGWLPA